MFTQHQISEAEHHSWFKRLENDPRSCWYIHENQQGKPDGVVNFTEYQSDERSTFWGFYLATDAVRGAGTELGLEGLDEGFHVLNLHKLNSEVLSINERSIHFHKKLGFQEEGLFRNHYFDGVNYIDIVRLAILKTEWVDHRKSIKKRIEGSVYGET